MGGILQRLLMGGVNRMSRGKRGVKDWDQRPGEPNPQYIGFVLYLSLGPQRDKIVETDTGKYLWEMLMAGLERMKDDAPLPMVCEIMISVLNNTLGDGPEGPGNDEASKSVFEFHKKLKKDRKLRSSIRKMITNLEVIQRGDKIR